MGTVGVSGSGINATIYFPSGQISDGLPGADLDAALRSFSSIFGFNDQPHQFNLSFVSQGVRANLHGASGQTPNINTELSMTIGSFFLRGFITHSEYSVSPGGVTVDITMEDRRRILRRVKVTTDDLGKSRPSGVVSVPAELRDLYEFQVSQERDIITWEYRKILERGATYAEIYTALQNAYNHNRSDVDPTKLPSPDVIAGNLGGADAAAVRFQFDFDMLDRVINQVMQDSAYDWYWDMSQDKVNVINRKVPFEIDESALFDALDDSNYTTLRFGKDAVQEPSRVRLLGGRKQGFWNSPLLSPIDGIDLPSSGLVFYPAWQNITVQFIDAAGKLRSYVPSDQELQMALAGIEQWTYFKIYQTAAPGATPPGFEQDSDAGSIAAQHPEFQSRIDPTEPLSELLANPSGNLRVINNRRDAQDNWVMSFYNRVNDHSQRHFGRSYVASGILYNQASGYLRVMNAAWANIENQIEGHALSPNGSSGPFIQGYEINKSLGPVSPFIQQDYRVAAHCVLPSGSVYGAEGEDVPASFGSWSEDVPPFSASGSREHYIPIQLREVGQQIRDPRDSSDIYGFQLFPDGTVWCQFPTIIGTGRSSGTVLDTLATLIESINNANTSGEFDLYSPNILIDIYNSISGVAMPIETNERYGDGYPDTWVSGTIHPVLGEQFVSDEQFAPWNFFPAGNQNSVDIMDIRAKRRLRGLFIDAINSRYAEIRQPGFPALTFDNFADQQINSSGLYGVRDNGIASMSFSFGVGGVITTYRINDFYAAYTKIPPLGDREFPAFQGGVTPINFDIFGFDVGPSRSIPITPPQVQYSTSPESFSKKVEIVELNNILNITLGGAPIDPERYFGQTKNGVRYPNSGRRNDGRLMSDGTECIDGFLNEGDPAIFHYQEEGKHTGESVTFYYFTGGHALNARIVEVVSEEET